MPISRQQMSFVIEDMQRRGPIRHTCGQLQFFRAKPKILSPIYSDEPGKLIEHYDRFLVSVDDGLNQVLRLHYKLKLEKLKRIRRKCEEKIESYWYATPSIDSLRYVEKKKWRYRLDRCLHLIKYYRELYERFDVVFPSENF